MPPRLRVVRAALSLVLAVAAGAGVGAGTAAPAAAATTAAPTATAAATASANPPGSAIAFALQQLGKPYLYGGVGPARYDCSGLTQAAYRAAGIAIPRVSRDQYRLLPKVSSSLARPGDLIFWATDPANPATIHHVAIFLGGGMMIDSPRTGTVVRVRPVYTRGVMRHVARPGGARVAALLPVERGSRGDDVRALQLRLRANGFAVPVTGWYGPMTYTAVRTFQRRTGVSATGLVGPSTWAHLVVNGVQVRPS